MDNKAALRQKLHAMKMHRTKRNTIIKKQEKQEKQEKISSKEEEEKEGLIDSELPPLEDY
jgi:hypothetical protein